MKRGVVCKGKPLTYLSRLADENLKALECAISYCHAHGIGCFRVLSGLFPLCTHPEFGYQIQELPDAFMIEQQLQRCCSLAKACDIRLTFHPDQFVVLNSPHPQVIENSLKEIEFHANLADKLGADVINIHAGGVYGNKAQALQALEKNLSYLSEKAIQALTLENDDTRYTPRDLLPFCQKHKIPFVYDVHHHRCLPDQATVEETTERALQTWNREPLFHLSSPREGWQGRQPKWHHDFIDICDLPECWRKIDPLTVEIEAKAKEIAVLKFLDDFLKN